MKTRSLAALLTLSASMACSFLQPVWYHPTKTDEESRIDYLECKKESASDNLKDIEQFELKKACMERRGHKLMTADEAAKLEK